jgi:phosphatidylserine/phosphatidylglycerophosphate/cardiolipin synthase-like enzyme
MIGCPSPPQVSRPQETFACAKRGRRRVAAIHRRRSCITRGVETLIDHRHAIAHSKVMIIDAETVITGSFNFTKAAEERNSENLLIIRDHGLAKKYIGNFLEHARHAREYKRKEGKAAKAEVRGKPEREK